MLPAGSILAYFYFGLVAHQVDVIGLLVKSVEAGVIVAAIAGLLAARGGATEGRRSPA